MINLTNLSSVTMSVFRSVGTRWCFINIVVAMSIFVSLSACAPQGSNAEAAESTERIINSVATPTTAIELIKNFKIAQENHLFLRSDFFVKEKMEKIFGGKKITTHINDVNNLDATVFGFDEMIKPIESGIFKFGAVNIELKRVQKNDGNIQGEFFLRVIREGVFPNFKDVERIFGSDWVGDEDKEVSPHRIFKKPTNQFGHAKIKYTYKDNGVAGILRIEFAADSSIYQINYIETK